MSNLQLWDKVRSVPDNAQKQINGGRLKGMTDINPMWRIKVLTEQFGVCGIGWKYEITSQRLEEGGKCERACFVDINLFVKVGDDWSAAIPGIGGSMFIANEKNGLYTSDECFKMALTDAISVACKSLGIGADVYWQTGATKYSGKTAEDNDEPAQHPKYQHTGSGKPTKKQMDFIFSMVKDLISYGYPESYGADEIRKQFGKASTKELAFEEASQLITSLKSDLEDAKERVAKSKAKFNAGTPDPELDVSDLEDSMTPFPDDMPF